METKVVTLLDYGAGNVRSVANAIEHLGFKVHFVESPSDIKNAEKLIFPGVGSFGEMMKTLKSRDFIAPLREYLKSNRPYLGICLGLQALFEASEESPDVSGIGFLKGRVRRLKTNLSIPHIGWNNLKPRKPSILFDSLKGDEHLYFVHSYVVEPYDHSVILTTTDYGEEEFVSSIQAGNVIATQFHPEKSGEVGLKILENFLLSDKTPCLPLKINTKTSLAKRVVACMDVREDDRGELVVTKGDQYDVRDSKTKEVRNLGRPSYLAEKYYKQGADEIAFLNITGYRNFPLLNQPMLDVLKETSKHVFVPLTIGGGITSYTDKDGRSYSGLEVASMYFRSGADKISIGTDAVLIAEQFLYYGIRGKSSIEEISKVYGNQAVVISIDPKRRYVASPYTVRHHVIFTEIPGPDNERYCWFQCTIKGGREARDIDAITLARICEELGAGEILLNSIDRDGTNLGFDLELIRAVSDNVNIPVIASSGAGGPNHFLEVFQKTNAEAALAAGILHRGQTTIKEIKEYLKGNIPVRLT
ncbi:MAG TPA: imidazole glycerol phosphate synthase subunit HisF [Syntrophorhabdaceae bacterium]|nr:imidazole glycerol phosphate synthase subunit HisF [Syntrophorhabdaceae bacterium]HOL04615.1 imidazole glycerol phosphate synthase subunit HisF [Syntrophorhabdaceae bacterium]HPP41328.1 imidazole glycerol phosphate synthase subunit HisF [Syntrophorhabdaceae bacterium]